MKILKVYFIPEEVLGGSAVMCENLITNEVTLELSDKLFLGEIKALTNKALKILKPRYQDIKAQINWDSLKESDK